MQTEIPVAQLAPADQPAPVSYGVSPVNYNPGQQQQFVTVVHSLGAWPGVGPSAHPLHATVLTLAIIGLIFGWATPWSLGVLASLFATVGSSVYLCNCCLRSPGTAQVVCWLTGAAGGLSLIVVISSAVSLAWVCENERRDACSFTTVFMGASILLYTLIAIFAGVSLWKTLPATRSLSFNVSSFGDVQMGNMNMQGQHQAGVVAI